MSDDFRNRPGYSLGCENHPVRNNPTACARLQEADLAYHALMRGQVARSVTDGSGESVQFTQANADKLLAYIRELQAQCTDYIAVSVGNGYRKPIRFFF